MTRQRAKKQSSEHPVESAEVIESLWRVVDAARLVIRRWDNIGVSDQEIREFLADQEKMLRRAVAFFHGGPDVGEEALRADGRASKHPYVLEIEARDTARFEEYLRQRNAR